MMRRCTLLLVLGLGMPSLVFAQGTEEVLYIHTDAIGSVRMITDASGQVVERYDYLPFGEPWPASPTGDETRRFTGQERDADTGLDYFGARYYASGNGRFTRPDDPGYSNPTDPQTLNLYVYVRNNPLRFVDPTGHVGECPPESSADFCSGIDEAWESTKRWIIENLFRNPAISIVPVIGPLTNVYEQTERGCVQGAVLNAGIAISDVFLVKGATVSLGRGAWKLGSNAWSATRSWYGATRGLLPGQHVHHWAIRQGGWGARVPDALKNQPWNLMPLTPPPGISASQWHNAIHGSRGTLDLGVGQRLWYGTPNWAKNFAANISARAGQAANWADCH